MLNCFFATHYFTIVARLFHLNDYYSEVFSVRKMKFLPGQVRN